MPKFSNASQIIIIENLNVKEFISDNDYNNNDNIIHLEPLQIDAINFFCNLSNFTSKVYNKIEFQLYYNKYCPHSINYQIHEMNSSTTLYPKTASSAKFFPEFFYLTSFICLAGIVGNLLSLKVFFSSKVPRTSSRIYLIALTISDAIFIMVHLIDDICREILYYFKLDIPINITDQSVSICRFIVLLRNTCRCASPWIIVAFTLERFLVVNFPNHSNVISKPLWAKRLVYCIISISILISLYSPIFTGIIHQNIIRKGLNSSIKYSDMKNLLKKEKKYTFNELGLEQHFFTRSCDVMADYRSIYLYFTIFYTTMVILVPLVVVSIFNANLIIRLYKSTDQWASAKLEIHEQEMSYKELRDKKVQIENMKITWMLVIISVAFILLTLPHAIIYFIKHFNAFTSVSSMNKKTPTSSFNRTLNIISKFSELMYILNHCINFFLYTVTRKSFRKVLKEKLKCECFNAKNYIYLSKGNAIGLKHATAINFPICSTGHGSSGVSEIDKLNSVKLSNMYVKETKDPVKQSDEPQDYESYWQTVPVKSNETGYAVQLTKGIKLNKNDKSNDINSLRKKPKK